MAGSNALSVVVRKIVHGWASGLAHDMRKNNKAKEMEMHGTKEEQENLDEIVLRSSFKITFDVITQISYSRSSDPVGLLAK